MSNSRTPPDGSPEATDTILLDTPKESDFPIAPVIAGITSVAVVAVALLYIKKAKFSAKR
jgi:hypothetical protein